MTIRTRDIGDVTEDWLRQYLGNRDCRTLAHNTVLVRDTEGLPDAAELPLGVVFHATRIVTFNGDGTLTLNTNGYRTVTTKQRINALLPPGYRIGAVRYVWYITSPDGVRQEFVDGMRIDPSMGTATAPHVGHYSHLGGTYWCDTCNSPYCELA